MKKIHSKKTVSTEHEKEDSIDMSLENAENRYMREDDQAGLTQGGGNASADVKKHKGRKGSNKNRVEETGSPTGNLNKTSQPPIGPDKGY